MLSCVQLSVTSWTVACQAPLSVGFFRQEYWSGLPFPPPETLPPRDQSRIFWVSCIAVRFSTTWAIGKALNRDTHTRYLIHGSNVLLLSCAFVHQATHLAYFSVSTVRMELPRAENHSKPSGLYRLSCLPSPHPPDSSYHTPVTGLPSVCKAVLQHPLKTFRCP